MFGKWAKRRDLESCHRLVNAQVLLGCLQKGHGVLLSRTLLENPARSPSRIGNNTSQSPHTVSNWENSLGKVKLFLLPFIRALRASQELSPSPWGEEPSGVCSLQVSPSSISCCGFGQLNVEAFAEDRFCG